MVATIIYMCITLALAAPSFAADPGAWDEIGASLKKGSKPATVAMQLQTTLLTTPNAKLSAQTAARFEKFDHEMRRLCAPVVGNLFVTDQHQVDGYIDAYLAGRLTYSDVVLRIETAKVQSNQANKHQNYTEIYTIKGMTGSEEGRTAIITAASAERERYIAGVYPGSSLACYRGQGAVAFRPTLSVTYRGERAWRIEETSGQLVTSFTDTGDGTYTVSVSMGTFSALAVLARPGQPIELQAVNDAIAKYKQSLVDASEKYDLRPDKLSTAYNSGASDAQLLEIVRDRYRAEAAALPDYYRIHIAGIAASQQIAAREMQEWEQEQRRRYAGSFALTTVQDAGFRIISLNLDSSRQKTLAEPEAAVRQNELIKHAEAVYQKRGMEMDVVTFLQEVLINPDLRQQIAATAEK